MNKSRGTRSKKFFWFACGIVVGSVAAFYLDPVQGRQRRIRFLAKERRMINDFVDHGVKAGRRFKHKVFGVAKELASRWSNEAVTDEVLKDRIRSAFGHVIHHARGIESSVEDGVVRLTGSVMEDELEALMRCVRRVKGVQRVINQLEIIH